MFARALPSNLAPYWFRQWYYRRLFEAGRIGGEHDGQDRYGEPYESLWGETW